MENHQIKIKIFLLSQQSKTLNIKELLKKKVLLIISYFMYD